MPTSVASAPPSISDPNELVGDGAGMSRTFGGLVGGSVGVAAMAGLTMLTRRSSITPVRIGGAVAGLAAIGGGAFLGQKLMGTVTRETRAEAQRSSAAKEHDLQVEIRTLQARGRGDLTSDDEARLKELRADRISTYEARPGPNWFGKFALPIAFGAGLAVLGAVTGGKLAPDDGKGLNAMFAGIGGGAAGLLLGGWSGVELGAILTKGPHEASLPDEARQRVDQIDREIDSLLGPAPA
jgi:hypothetical protein